AIAVRKQQPVQWVLLGGAGDTALAERIEHGILAAGEAPEGSVINLTGKTTLRELCAALQACSVVLTNDTGPMHLAAALGCRVAAIFGSTAPELTAPGLPRD